MNIEIVDKIVQYSIIILRGLFGGAFIGQSIILVYHRVRKRMD